MSIRKRGDKWLVTAEEGVDEFGVRRRICRTVASEDRSQAPRRQTARSQVFFLSLEGAPFTLNGFESWWRKVRSRAAEMMCHDAKELHDPYWLRDSFGTWVYETYGVAGAGVAGSRRSRHHAPALRAADYRCRAKAVAGLDEVTRAAPDSAQAQHAQKERATSNVVALARRRRWHHLAYSALAGRHQR
jgi:hypothetical protein